MAPHASGPTANSASFPRALAWKLHNEKWMANIPAVSEAKLRTSFGLSGNQEIGNYRYLANIGATPYVIGGVLNTEALPQEASPTPT